MTSLTFSNRGLTSLAPLFAAPEFVEIEPHALRSLDLSHNQLSSISPVTQGDAAAFAALAWLESLDVSNNNLRVLGALPSQVLRKLSVSHNYLQSLSELAPCRFLIALKASHNALTMLPSCLPRDLASLDISNNGIAAFDGALNGLKRLHTLRAHNNELEMIEDVLEQLRQLPELRYLHIAGNPCLAHAPTAHECAARRRAVVAACPALRSLDGVAVEAATVLQSQAAADPTPTPTPAPAAARYASPLQRSRSRSPGATETASGRFAAVDERARGILLEELEKQSQPAAVHEERRALAARRDNEMPLPTTTTASAQAKATTAASNNEHAAAAQQLRDERRRCQALREMLEREMRQEAVAKASVEQLRRQIRQEQALQRGQLGNLAQLRRECELARLDVERLKTDIAEEQLVFLELHAASRERRVAAAASSPQQQ